MKYSVYRIITTTSFLFVFISEAYRHDASKIESTKAHKDVDQIAIFLVAKSKGAKVDILTAHGQPITVKPDSKDHAHSYKVHDVECKVQKGAFHIILPHDHPFSYWGTRYRIDYLLSGHEKTPRMAIVTDTKGIFDKVLLIIRVTDPNSHLTAVFGQNELPNYGQRSAVTERYIRFKELGHLYIQAELGRAAEKMLEALGK